MRVVDVVDEINAPPNYRLVYDGHVIHCQWSSKDGELHSETGLDAALCHWYPKEVRWGRKKGWIEVSIFGQDRSAAFRVDAAHAEAVTAWLDRYVARAGADRPRSEGTSSPTGNTAGASGDLSEPLANLTSLHTQGALSDDEFAQAKAKLLDAGHSSRE